MIHSLLKVCTSCGEALPLSEFHAHKRHKDGLQYHCKRCISAEGKLNAKKNWARTLVKSAEGYARRPANGRKIIPCTLTVEWVLAQYELQVGKCFHSGLLMRTEVDANPLYRPSIERLDCDVGHHPENCVLAAMFINIGRGNKAIPHLAEILQDLKHAEPDQVRQDFISGVLRPVPELRGLLVAGVGHASADGDSPHRRRAGAQARSSESFNPVQQLSLGLAFGPEVGWTSGHKQRYTADLQARD
jgi:hypothetical protein